MPWSISYSNKLVLFSIYFDLCIHNINIEGTSIQSNSKLQSTTIDINTHKNIDAGNIKSTIMSICVPPAACLLVLYYFMQREWPWQAQLYDYFTHELYFLYSETLYPTMEENFQVAV